MSNTSLTAEDLQFLRRPLYGFFATRGWAAAAAAPAGVV
jgi:hypothetical protein